VRRPLPVALLGTGSVGGSRRVTSDWLDDRYDRTPGSTRRRSGVATRPWAGPAETSSSLAAEALRRALAAADVEAADLDALIVASVVPEQPMPTTAALVLQRLGLGAGGMTAFDVNTSCLGFLTGLELAGHGIAACRWRHVSVVAVDLASPGLDHGDLETSALFGDGAAAAVLGVPRAGAGVLATRFATYPAGARLCEIAAGGTRYNVSQPPPRASDYLFRMDGLGVMRLASRHLPGFLAALLDEAGTDLAGIDVVIPHQASELGLRFLRQRLGVPADKVVDILADHGNQVSASLPTALDVAARQGRLPPGTTALLIGTGAGLVLGGAVVRL